MNSNSPIAPDAAASGGVPNHTSGTKKHYSAISRWLHWLMAFLILAMLTAGLSLDVVTPDRKPGILFWHESFGVVLLALAMVRVVARLRLSSPPPLAGSRHEHRAAMAVHGFLYFVMICLPLTGWLMVSAMDRPVNFFGMITLPNLIAADRVVAFWFKTRHWQLAYGLIGLLAVHIGAVLFHQYVRRDQTLRRMWPERERESPAGRR